MIRYSHCTNGIEYVGGFWVAASIAESLTSIAGRVSYSVGACRIIPAVPTMTAIVKIHKNSLSKTIATYFQSSLTLLESSSLRVISAIYLTPSTARTNSGQKLSSAASNILDPVRGLKVGLKVNSPWSLQLDVSKLIPLFLLSCR